MKSTLTGLVQLQNVDKELQSLEALKGDLPQQVQKLRDQLAVLKADLISRNEELTEAKKEHALLEAELGSLQGGLNKYREQLYAVTSNKEYDAITTEIDAAQEKISDAEDQVLERIQREEDLGEAIEELEPKISELTEHLAETEKELSEKILATETEYKSYQEQRDQLAGSIQRPALYQYERIRKGLGNNAVAEIQSAACGGCYSAIPPQKVVEIKMMNRLIHCESCGRILVHVDDKVNLPN